MMEKAFEGSGWPVEMLEKGKAREKIVPFV
jgi:hypothetical protein